MKSEWWYKHLFRPTTQKISLQEKAKTSDYNTIIERQNWFCRVTEYASYPRLWLPVEQPLSKPFLFLVKICLSTLNILIEFHQISSPYTDKVYNTLQRSNALRILKTTEEQNVPLNVFRGCELTWQGMEKRNRTAHSCLKSAISVWLKLGKSLGGRSFIKPFAADLYCSFSRADREPGYSSRALAFQKVPAPLA